jgi:hypothetical protein
MAYFRLALNAGIDKQNTEYGAEGGWTDGDNVRFRFGLPEKIGGWTNFNGVASYLVGFASETFSWNNNAGVPYLAVGTDRKIYVSAGGCVVRHHPSYVQLRWPAMSPSRRRQGSALTHCYGARLTAQTQATFVTFS